MAEHVREWLAGTHYLSIISDTLADKWLSFWNSDLLAELTKPDKLALFGFSALAGVLVPLIAMLGWRLFNRRKGQKDQKSAYQPIVEDSALGSFNSKVISSVKTTKRKSKTKDFDPIPQSAADEVPTNLETNKSESASSLNTTDDQKTLLQSKPKPAKKKEKEGVNATRFASPEFKLDDKEVEELSHMKLHGKLKSATLRARADKFEESMSVEEREKERQMKMAQLESIFKMMQSEGNKFGITNKEELMDQFKIYGS